MIPRPLQIRTISDLPPLTWQEMAYGYSEQLLGWRTPVEIAVADVEKGSTDSDELDLASVDKEQTWRVVELIQRLAAKEHRQTKPEILEKWLYVVLKWLYDNKDSFSDPLQEVEEVYADFGYPEIMNRFVRFLPSSDEYQPELHTKEENVRRMYEHWLAYLNTAAGRFSGV
jgi:hypothetical protein